MEEIKTFYGNAVLTENDLKGTGITNKIVLDYFKVETPEKTNTLGYTSRIYGIEVIKKEYLDEQNFVQEKKCINCISQNESFVSEILSKIKNYKVTPIALQYVVDDLKQA